VPSRRGRPPDKERGRPLGKGGLQVTDALNAVDASTITDPGDAVIVDLATERRRRRPALRAAWFCPQRYGAFRSAAIAELSARDGSLEATYRRLDQERAATQALAEARRTAVATAIDQLGWLAEQERRRREWFATPLQVPQWAAGESGAAS
jgi:hypothetical protein